MQYSLVPVSRVKKGTRLICDGGFTCVENGEVVVIDEDDSGLFFRCGADDDGDFGKPATSFRNEHHYLDGQLNDEGTHYVGFWFASRTLRLRYVLANAFGLRF